jgi:hypothetical protein
MTNMQPSNPTPAPAKPNEQGSVSVQAFVRIFDPQTQKTILEGRA